MNMWLTETSLIAVVLLNFVLLGSSRIAPLIRMTGLQGFIIGVLPLVGASHLEADLIIVSCLAAALKGFLFPALLLRAVRNTHIRKEVEPTFGFIATMLLGAAGTALALVFARSLPLIDEFRDTLLVPTALSTILTGFLLLITRLKAISQVVGFLVLENGIFLFGLTLLRVSPLVVELGALLDLFVAIFIMGIILYQIQRTFSSLDTTRMALLRD